LFAGLFTKEPAAAEKDAVINFGPGMELTERSHPSEYNPQHSQAIEKISRILAGGADKPINHIMTALCRAPYGLTPEMVTLYLFALVRSGGWEIGLNPTTQFQLSNGRPLSPNRLTAHTLGLVKWNAQLPRPAYDRRNSMLLVRLVIIPGRPWVYWRLVLSRRAAVGLGSTVIER
jgi:hypothetical protein